eukprot:scaffold229061_cov36-Prasinocladus_malaysianus.AAC.1
MHTISRGASSGGVASSSAAGYGPGSIMAAGAGGPAAQVLASGVGTEKNPLYTMQADPSFKEQIWRT